MQTYFDSLKYTFKIRFIICSSLGINKENNFKAICFWPQKQVD